MELSAEEVDAGEVDKLVQEVVQTATEVLHDASRRAPFCI